MRSGQHVRRGETIGTVGRTGCKESPAHLHLELKSAKELFDARDVMTDVLVGDPPWRSAREERRARRERAVVAREAAYPYEVGKSPIVRVTVRGR